MIKSFDSVESLYYINLNLNRNRNYTRELIKNICINIFLDLNHFITTISNNIGIKLSKQSINIFIDYYNRKKIK